MLEQLKNVSKAVDTLLASDGMLVRRPLLVLEDSVLVGFREDAWNKVLGQNVT